MVGELTRRRLQRGPRRLTLGFATGVAVVSLSLMAARPSLAVCPGYLFGDALPKGFLEQQTPEIKLYVADGTDRKAGGSLGFREIALQIDGLNKDGVLRKQKEPKLLPWDRFVMPTEKFGERVARDLWARHRFACQSVKVGARMASPNSEPEVLELSSDGGGEAGRRYAYLVRCDAAPKALVELPVRADRSRSTVSSDFFYYRHNPENLLLFDEIKIHSPPWQMLGRDGDMLMHLDVKHFFTLDLDRDDMTSELVMDHVGAMGISHRVAFFIHILFFKVDLELETLFSFYADSAHAPMKFHVPSDAKESLHRGSGMLLHWDPGVASLALSHEDFKIPEANPQNILRAKNAVTGKGRELTQYCGNKVGGEEECLFVLPIQVGGDLFKIQMRFRGKYVKRGFYPQLVKDINSFVDQMDWSEKKEAFKGRVGIFMDNSQLPAGVHEIDHWFVKVDPKYPKARCPRSVKVEAF